MSKTKWHAKPLCHCERSVAILLALALVLSLGITAVPMAGMVEASPDTDYYVDDDGNDGNDGLSEANAWKTITYALTQVGANDTIIVLPGTYNAANGEAFPLTITQAGLTIKSSAGAASTIIAPTSADRPHSR